MSLPDVPENHTVVDPRNLVCLPTFGLAGCGNPLRWCHDCEGMCCGECGVGTCDCCVDKWPEDEPC